jgi:hypothetical protein
MESDVMQLTKIWVMICEPQKDAYTKPFTGTDISECVEYLQEYLAANTSIGTRTEIIQAGYVDAGASINGI